VLAKTVGERAFPFAVLRDLAASFSGCFVVSSVCAFVPAYVQDASTSVSSLTTQLSASASSERTLREENLRLSTSHDDMLRRLEELEAEKEEQDDRDASVKRTLLEREVSVRFV